MTGNDGERVEFTGLPVWADEFVARLDEEFGVCTGDLAAKNFPDESPPRWLQGRSRAGRSSAPEWLKSFFSKASPTLQSLWVEEGFLSTDPEWLADINRRDRADVARVFLLTGNVHDYAFSPDSGYLPIIDCLEENAIRRKDWVIRYSLSNGFERVVRGESTPDDEPTPLEELDVTPTARDDWDSHRPQDLLERDLQIMESVLSASYNGGVSLLIDNLHLLVPPDSKNVNQNVLIDAVTRWAQAPWMFQSENQVVLLTESAEALARDLRSTSNHIQSLSVPRPETRGDRLKFLVSLFTGAGVASMPGVRLGASAQPRFGEEFETTIDEKLVSVAERTSGLNYVGLENLVLEVHAAESQRLTLDFIKEQKRELLAEESGGLLEVSEPDAAADRSGAFEHIGGLDAVCEKLSEISELLEQAAGSELIRRSLPSGLLFLGPPGTGKTLTAQAFANASGVNFAELGNIRSMYVGESERNLSRALELIRSLAPVVVFMDEIDQTMGQRRGQADSGVDQRLFARILQFMSDPELNGEVIWIGASNAPRQIDPALKRAGRFDLVVPFLRPDREARREIFRIHVTDRGAELALSDAAWDRFLTETEGYTGAELENLAKEAIWSALTESDAVDPVSIADRAVESALGAYQPPANRTDFERMERDALKEVTSIEMLTDEQQKRRVELADSVE